MDFLTLDLIKTHCRIEDYSRDKGKQREIDNNIRKCAEKGEKYVYEDIGKNYFDIIKEYGEIPISIMQAALIATADILLYDRHPRANFAFTALLRPYKKK